MNQNQRDIAGVIRHTGTKCVDVEVFSKVFAWGKRDKILKVCGMSARNKAHLAPKNTKKKLVSFILSLGKKV